MMSFCYTLALTLNAVKMVLEELASFHATGHHFVNTFPGGMEALNKEYQKLFQEKFFDNEKKEDNGMEQFLVMVTKMFGASIVVAKNYGSEDLAERLEAYQKSIKSEMEKLFFKKWQMSFVCHGDAWYNNFLFRSLLNLFVFYITNF
jgi:thiamine kinase-like enzyme